MAPPPPERRHRRRWPWLILVVLVITAGTFGATRIPLSPDETVATATVPTTPITTPAPLPVQEEAPPVTVGELSALEPVADIAEAVAPAVVQIETNAGVGSGVIYDSDGLILTAAHVIDGARPPIRIRLASGAAVEGDVVGAHAGTDIAVIRLPGAGYPTAQLAVGDDIRVGSLAVALGSPFGLDQTVTAGIVSAVDRSIGSVSMVQTDAAINPGNSGGPLVDSRGRVIGINDQIFTQSGDNAGIGFAVSIDLAKIVADQIVAGEPVRLAFLGVSTQASTTDQPGALVQDVIDGSAAEAAGIEIGDVIVSVDGRPVTHNARLRVLIISTAPGEVVEVELIRNGERVQLAVELGQTP